MNTKRHCYPSSIILQAVYFKLRFTLSYRDVEEIMKIREIRVDHATIQRWVLNRDLHEIYHYLYKDYKFIATSSIFYNPDGANIAINQENIKTKLREYFIFLKPGEIYVDSYDLTGFNILGGE